jgi:hypothetical protein
MSLSGDVVATANLRPPIAPFRILFGPRSRPQTLAQQQQSAAKRKATGTGTGGSPTKKRKLGSGKASGLNFLDDNNNGQEAIDPNESFLERRDRIKRQKWKSRQALELAGHPVEILPAVTQKSAAKAIAAVTAVQEVKSDDGGDRDDKGDVAVVSEEKKLAPTYPSSTLFFDLSACDRYHSLERQDADQCKEESDGKRPSHAGKFIWWRTRRQRGEWWRREREYFRGLSGSKLIAALLLFPPAEGKKPVEYLINWYKTYLPDSKELILLQDLKDSSEETSVGQECMDWGTFHEIDGLASFLHHLGNVLDVDIYETTLSPVQLSPDLIKEVLIGEVERVTNRKWRPLTVRTWYMNQLTRSLVLRAHDCLVFALLLELVRTWTSGARTCFGTVPMASAGSDLRAFGLPLRSRHRMGHVTLKRTRSASGTTTRKCSCTWRRTCAHSSDWRSNQSSSTAC